MKDLIIPALQKAWVNLEAPTSKKVTRQMIIDDVAPVDLISFMNANNIPPTAYFSGRANGYDAFDAIVLEWEVEVPTTWEDNEGYHKRVFNGHAFRYVSAALIEAGYKRVSPNSSEFKKFPSVYEMLFDEDMLVSYYSLYFVKK